MEPNQEGNKQASAQPNDDLHAEGIDLVGSGVSDENEFSSAPSEEKAVEEAPTPEILRPAEAKIPVPPMPIQTAQTPQAMPEAAKQAFTAVPPTSVSVSAPIPVQKQPQKEIVDSRNDPSIRPLRTFKSDAEEAVRYGGVSKINMVVAEQKKREASGSVDYVKENKPRARLIIFIILALLCIGFAGWYYLSSSVRNAPMGITASAANMKSIVPFTKGTVIVLDASADPLALIEKKLATGNAGIGNVFGVIPVSTSTSTSQAPIARIFSNTHIPSRLARSLGESYMFGVYTFDTESPFLILTNTFYQNAFSGMLEWENNLKNDFSSFIMQSYPTASLVALDTALFVDSVISNIDVRELKDSSGKVMLAYAFADKDTIVLTTSESALKYLLDRLLQVRTIQ